MKASAIQVNFGPKSMIFGGFLEQKRTIFGPEWVERLGAKNVRVFGQERVER